MSAAGDQLLAEVREEIGRADNKASILLAGVTAFVGLVASSWLQGQSALSNASAARAALVAASLTATLVAGIALGSALFPRGLSARDATKGSFYFYGDSIHWTEDTLCEYLAQLSEEDRSKRTARQLLLSSRIARRKYLLIRFAIWAMGAAAALFVVAIPL